MLSSALFVLNDLHVHSVVVLNVIKQKNEICTREWNYCRIAPTNPCWLFSNRNLQHFKQAQRVSLPSLSFSVLKNAR